MLPALGAVAAGLAVVEAGFAAVVWLLVDFWACADAGELTPVIRAVSAKVVIPKTDILLTARLPDFYVWLTTNIVADNS